MSLAVWRPVPTPLRAGIVKGAGPNESRSSEQNFDQPELTEGRRDGGDNIPSLSRHPEPPFRRGFSFEIPPVAARHPIPALTDPPATASWWSQNNAGTDKVSCPNIRVSARAVGTAIMPC